MKIDSKSPGHVAVQCDFIGCSAAMSFDIRIGLHNACVKHAWLPSVGAWSVLCPDHKEGVQLENRPYRIALSYVDNRESFRKGFALSLMRVMLNFQAFSANLKAEQGVEYELNLIPSEYGNVAEMREAVADAAIDGEYDAIMWMDSDMVFPDDAVQKLLYTLNANEEIDGVTGLYTYKKPPYLPHVYGRLDEDTGYFDIASSFPLDSPFYVDGAGFGCLLLRTKTFQRVLKPYFSMEFKNGRMVAGEDLVFCRNAKTKLILDPTVACGHLAESCVGINDYLRFNNIKVVDGALKVTEEQRSAIMSAMPHLSVPKGKEE